MNYPFNIYGIKDMWYNTIHHIQRIYRRNHVSDRDIWGIYYRLAEISLPKLIAFKNSNRHGTPMFDDYTEDETDDQCEAREKKWDDILDKMIMGMKYVLMENDSRKYKKYEKELKDQFGDWDAKTEENKHYFLWKRTSDNMSQLCDDPSELSDEDIKERIKEDGPNWLEKSVFYYNCNLYNEISKKAQEGLKLYGEYFMNLWD